MQEGEIVMIETGSGARFQAVVTRASIGIRLDASCAELTLRVYPDLQPVKPLALREAAIEAEVIGT